MISSYVGENQEFERQYLSGELEVELTPQVLQYLLNSYYPYAETYKNNLSAKIRLLNAYTTCWHIKLDFHLI